MIQVRDVGGDGEIIFQSGEVLLRRCRQQQGEGTVLVKEYLGDSAPHTALHERRILERLRDVPGVPALVAGDCAPGRLVLADPSAIPLASFLHVRRPDSTGLLDLSLQLARVITAIHGAGVAHKNLSLDAILWCRATNALMVHHFCLATTLAEQCPSFFLHDRDFGGGIGYRAPEETGRTGRPVDYRADLYSLGAILYRIATGVLPFAHNDPLQLIHDILAQPPVPPAELVPSLPRSFSRIILRLLQKEPDRRYQSAAGLAYDLARLVEALAAGKQGELPLGEHDFPLVISAPSRLVGRDAELAVLHDSLEKAMNGGGASLVVAGAPGVGKTSLINELRPMVAARRGWFVSGKFDQYRRDLESDAVRQSLSGLGRLLLAEPESHLQPLRERILQKLGKNCGLTTSVVPELRALLGIDPEPLTGDALQSKGRLVLNALEIFKSVASPERPLVLVLDDLQWAAPTPLALVDALMSDPVPGLLLVAIYRDGEIDTAHPLTPMLARWGAAAGVPPFLRLSNLCSADLSLLLRHMLRLRQHDSDGLAAAIEERTGGNPYHTVELVNALRRDGILVLGEDGWSWDVCAIRRYVGCGDLLELLSCRIGRLDADSQEVVHALACLGGEVSLPLLVNATAVEKTEIERRLQPALEDGVLVLHADGATVKFAHDRVQQAAYARLDESSRMALQLALARRLGPLPDFLLVAAGQYLSAIPLLEDPAECLSVVALLRTAAAKMKWFNFAGTERFLSAALRLVRGVDGADSILVVDLETELHAALYSLARLEEADEVYRSIEGRCSDPTQLAAAACLQVCSLTNRRRPADAVAFGLSVLNALGVAVPPDDDLDDEVGRGLAALEHWPSEESAAADLQRPEVTDLRILSIARLINRMIPPAYFSGQPFTNWLVLLGHRLWVEHGPCAALVGPLSHASFMTVAVRGDFRTGYRVVRHALAVSEARGYEPDASQCRFLFALSSRPWFEPVEKSLRLAQESHEGLLRGGDLQNACFTYYASIPVLFDCAETLDAFSAALEACLAFTVRTGNSHCTTHFTSYKALVRLLVEGEPLPEPPGEGLRLNGTTSAQFHCSRALGAAICGEMPELIRHSREAFRLFPYLIACYISATFHLLYALSLAYRLRSERGGPRATLLAELDASLEWLEARAADAPDNYLHLALWVRGECAWVLDDLRGALTSFEAAMAELVTRQRPWHRALITERAALCHLAHGLELSGMHLMGDALRHYAGWGAHAKVKALEQAYPALRAPLPKMEPDGGRHGVSSDAVDLLAVLRVSQALSSETSLERLRAQVVQLVENMTGATGVFLVLWQEEGGGWHLLPPELPPHRRQGIPLEEVVRQREIPATIFRYVERTRDPLLVHDAKRDDRFAFDPYFFPLECCSVLALPVLSQGALRAVLLLENRLSRGAFSDDRLDAVKLLGGQLAVSLENALLYEKLEERVRQRTAELTAAQNELVASARQVGMAEIATNVLHNVGNVLNSVNISAGVVMNAMRGSKSRELGKVVQLVKEQGDDLARFFAEDKKGRLLPAYLERLAAALNDEQQGVMGELSRLMASVDHIKEIVAAQQSYARGSSLMEPTRIQDLVKDALRINEVALQRHRVAVVHDFADLPAFPIDKARVLQILVNLISNAKHAMHRTAQESAVMTLKTELVAGRLRVTVADRGEGIAPENLLRIFSHGFTTRKGGHGFGLHSSALAAKEMGGTLTARSPGVGQGAAFTLELPVNPSPPLPSP